MIENTALGYEFGQYDSFKFISVSYSFCLTCQYHLSTCMKFKLSYKLFILSVCFQYKYINSSQSTTKTMKMIFKICE